MRPLRFGFPALLLILARTGAAQTTQALPQLPKEPRAIFAAAQPLYDFNDPSLRPYHLKAAYQLYEHGQPTEHGTFEYWWASPSVDRSTWTRGANTVSQWHTAGGKFAYLSTGSGIQFFESKLKAELLSPLPDPKDYAASDTYFDKEDVKLGSLKVPCIMIVPKMPTRGQPLQVPIGLFPTYCFDPSLPVVVAKSSFGALQVVYEKSVRVQNRILPNSLSEYEGRDKVLSASVESIEALSPTDPALIPPPEAMKPPVERVQLGAAIVAGRRIGGIVPIYPADAKAVRAQGTVVLRAVIGRDGRIHDLKVMSAPYPSLVESAMWAVSQWTYKPYLLNGQPVEVDTQINVTYKLGG